MADTLTRPSSGRQTSSPEGSGRTLFYALAFGLAAPLASHIDLIALPLLGISVGLSIVQWARTGFSLNYWSAVLAAFVGINMTLGFLYGGYPLPWHADFLASITTEVRWVAPAIVAFAAAAANQQVAQQALRRLYSVIPLFVVLTAASVLFYGPAIRPGFLLFGLARTHHVPGLVFGGLGLLLLLARRELPRHYSVTALACFVLVAWAQSRTAIVAIGFAGVVNLVFGRHFSHTARVRILIGSIGLAIVLLSFSDRARDTVIYVTQPQAIEAISQSFSAPGGTLPASIQNDEGLRNFVLRFQFFGEGTSASRTHWVAGVGPGRLNDYLDAGRPTESAPLPPSTMDRTLNESTSHNFFIQVVAETGLIGFPFLLALMVALVKQVPPRSRMLGTYTLALGLSSAGLLTLVGSMSSLPLAALLLAADGSQD